MVRSLLSCYCLGCGSVLVRRKQIQFVTVLLCMLFIVQAVVRCVCSRTHVIHIRCLGYGWAVV